MEDLKTQCLSKLDFNVHTFYRYVDDIFMIIPAKKLNSVLITFNNYHLRLKFTHKVKNNMLNFLNISVIRDNGNIITNLENRHSLDVILTFTLTIQCNIN